MRTRRRPAVLLAVGAALAVAAFVSLLVVGQPQVRGQAPLLSEDEAALLALINDYRLQHGLSTLKVSPTLSAAAHWMSEDMAEHARMNHTDSQGRNPSERLAAFGYTQASLWGEIIRAGTGTPQGAFDGWRSSPGHNAVMLTDGFVVAGVGKAYNPQSLYGWFWTVDFGNYDDGGVPLPTPTPTPTPMPTPEAEEQALGWAAGPALDDTMHNCPQAGKWSVATWSGQCAVPIEEALASCSQQVDVAYRINRDTQAWIRYLRDRPEISDLIAIDDGQGIIAWSAAVAAASTEDDRPQTGGGDKPSSDGFDADIASASNGETSGIPDPSAVYCGELGYQLRIVDTDEGQYGMCVFPDGSECDTWSFLAGKCGESYSYCARHGYGQITKTDGKNSYSGDYSVCVHDQEEIGAVTELMGLSERFAGGMRSCPRVDKWAISVWPGASGTPIDQAVANCTETTLAAAYWIDPQTQEWQRWFPGQPEISSLTSLDHMQAIIALGKEQA